jgi:predicted transcriptional regulator
MENVHEEKRHGLTIKIYQDEFPSNPREEDNLGTMICFHSRYNIGDEHRLSVEEAKQIEEEAKQIEARKDVISLPIFLYDHSVQSISTSSFIGRAQYAEWDSGRVGFIYVEKAKVRAEWKVKRISPKLHKKIVEILTAEVKTYDSYMRGECYGYEISDENDETVDNCGGYIGDYDDENYGALHDARAVVDRMTNNGQEVFPFAAQTEEAKHEDN